MNRLLSSEEFWTEMAVWMKYVKKSDIIECGVMGYMDENSWI